MRIAYTSDPHVDLSDDNRRTLERATNIIADANPDVIIVAGDAGNTIASLEETLAFFATFEVPRFFVAGNHDVWIEPGLDSREKYERAISAACARFGFDDLTREPVVSGGVGFVGSLGWYDYSFADPRLGLGQDDYWRGRWEDHIWWDKEMTLWTSRSDRSTRIRDPEVCDELVAALDRHLREVERRAGRIVAVVHTLAFEETLPRSDPPYYLDAFTGSRKLGETLAAHSKVEHLINGHKHQSGDWKLRGIDVHRRVLASQEPGESDAAYERRIVGFIDL